jgi:hypothetical protein
MPFPDPASRPLGHALDSFNELQVHGELSLENDVERLVAAPAFRDHPTARKIECRVYKDRPPRDGLLRIKRFADLYYAALFC